MKQDHMVFLRQQLEPVYVLNGAVYIAQTGWFLKNRQFVTEETIVYPMPQERSIDVDTDSDIAICDALLAKLSEKGHGRFSNNGV